MRIPIPHSLGREEARNRLRARSDEIAGLFPAGVANVQVTWPHDDQMNLSVMAMGKTVNSHVELDETTVTFVIDLPGSLAFFESTIRNAVEQKGRKLLT